MGRDKPDRSKFDYADAATFPGLYEDQSTCYAVYDFLERFADVRWYLPTELGLCCPSTKTLLVSGTDVRRSPAMKYRNPSVTEPFPADLCGDTVKEPKPPANLAWREQLLFELRYRLGGLAYSGHHSFDGYYDRFWRKNAKIPGTVRGFASRVLCPRLREGALNQGSLTGWLQPCYTCPGLVKQVVQDARDYFDGKGLKPGAVAAGDFFAVVPMDGSDLLQVPEVRETVGR